MFPRESFKKFDLLRTSVEWWCQSRSMRRPSCRNAWCCRSHTGRQESRYSWSTCWSWSVYLENVCIYIWDILIGGLYIPRVLLLDKYLCHKTVSSLKVFSRTTLVLSQKSRLQLTQTLNRGSPFCDVKLLDQVQNQHVSEGTLCRRWHCTLRKQHSSVFDSVKSLWRIPTGWLLLK